MASQEDLDQALARMRKFSDKMLRERTPDPLGAEIDLLFANQSRIERSLPSGAWLDSSKPVSEDELDRIKNILRQDLDYQSFIRGATSHGFHLVDSGVAIITQMDSPTGTISLMATRDGHLSTVMYKRKADASKVITLVDSGRLCS